jgi:hypothetical protein
MTATPSAANQPWTRSIAGIPRPLVAGDDLLTGWARSRTNLRLERSSMTDSSDGLRQKLDARSRQYADELARSEVHLIDLASTALAQWSAWWRDPTSLSELSPGGWLLKPTTRHASATSSGQRELCFQAVRRNRRTSCSTQPTRSAASAADNAGFSRICNSSGVKVGSASQGASSHPVSLKPENSSSRITILTKGGVGVDISGRRRNKINPRRSMGSVALAE